MAGLCFQEQLHPGNFNDQLWSIPTNSLYKLLQLLTGFATTALVLFWRTKATDKVELTFRSIALGMIWVLLFGPASEFPTFAFIAPFLGWAWLERKTWEQGRAFVANLTRFDSRLRLAELHFPAKKPFACSSLCASSRNTLLRHLAHTSNQLQVCSPTKRTRFS